MKEFLLKMIPIKTTDRFPFRCRQCGACCRRVRESVPLESLDVFRLAKFFRDSGAKIWSIDDVLAEYAEPVLLHESGYLIFMLKTVGEDDACIFLKDNRCTIHDVNPRACRTYPISIGPDGKGGYEQFISMEQPHHNNGPQMSVKKWVQRRCSKQDFAFWDEEYGTVKEIKFFLKWSNIIRELGSVFRKAEGKVKNSLMESVWTLTLVKLYLAYDMEKDFLPQFEDNSKELLALVQFMPISKGGEK